MKTLALLTAAGMAAVFSNEGVQPTAGVAKPAAPRILPDITAIATGLTIPTVASTSRGSKSPYEFDALEVGSAFGVKNKTAKQLSSIVSNQNRKDANQRQKTNADGSPAFKTEYTESKDANGAVVGRIPHNVPDTEWIKEFRAFDVTKEMAKSYKGTALEGSSVVVFRVK